MFCVIWIRDIYTYMLVCINFFWGENCAYNLDMGFFFKKIFQSIFSLCDKLYSFKKKKKFFLGIIGFETMFVRQHMK